MSYKARDRKRLRRHVAAAERSGKYERVSGFLNGRREWISGSARWKGPLYYEPTNAVAVNVPSVNYYGFVQTKPEDA